MASSWVARPEAEIEQLNQEEDIEQEIDNGWTYKTPNPMEFKSPFADKTIILSPILGGKHDVTSTQVADRLIEIGVGMRNNIEEIQKNSGEFRIGCSNKQAEEMIRDIITQNMEASREGFLKIGDTLFEQKRKIAKQREALPITLFGVPPEVSNYTIMKKLQDIVVIERIDHQYLKKYDYIKNGVRIATVKKVLKPIPRSIFIYGERVSMSYPGQEKVNRGEYVAKTCHKCGSKDHFLANCPQELENQYLQQIRRREGNILHTTISELNATDADYLLARPNQTFQKTPVALVSQSTEPKNSTPRAEDIMSLESFPVLAKSKDPEYLDKMIREEREKSDKNDENKEQIIESNNEKSEGEEGESEIDSEKNSESESEKKMDTQSSQNLARGPESDFDQISEKDLQEISTENYIDVVYNEIAKYKKDQEQKKLSLAEGGEKGKDPDPNLQPKEQRERKKKLTKKASPQEKGKRDKDRDREKERESRAQIREKVNEKQERSVSVKRKIQENKVEENKTRKVEPRNADKTI